MQQMTLAVKCTQISKLYPLTVSSLLSQSCMVREIRAPIIKAPGWSNSMTARED